jgi:hypothetical protein
MKVLIGAAAFVLALAPAAALACGDSMASASPEQLGYQVPAPASKASAATVAKATPDKAVKAQRTAREAKTNAKVKVAAND